MKNFLRSRAPTSLLNLYHRAWALGGAYYFGHPSRGMVVIGITGTKGKSTTTELVAALLRAAGHRVAVASTIHFVIDGTKEPNLYKMTMPGRARVQQFLHRARAAGCTHAIVEMTSEGAKQFRHLGLALDALVFLNLQPEHLESHGGMEQYANAKLELARALARSPKRPRIIVANADDEYGQRFLDTDVEIKLPFSLKDASAYTADDKSLRFVWRGTLFSVPLPGLFNLKNCLAALALCEALGVEREVARRALEHIAPIAGRTERVEQGQPFGVVVDFAHTPDSLRALFEAYRPAAKHMICVIGSMGGGRDTWNRPVKGAVAEEFCDITFVANEDPCDEDPQKILEAIAGGFKTKKPQLFVDRRAAIREALRAAHEGDVVLLTGKGTDPYILGPHGSREPWSEHQVAKEELIKMGYNT